MSPLSSSLNVSSWFPSTLLAETKTDPQFQEPTGRRGWPWVGQQQPEECGLLRSGERRKGGWDWRPGDGGQVRGRGVPAGGGRRWRRDFQSCAHTEWGESHISWLKKDQIEIITWAQWVSWFCFPLAGGCCAQVKWVITWPLGLLLYCTVPNCVLPRWHRWFMVTFLASTLWIAVFSYLMVWMVRGKKTFHHNGL